MPHMKSRSRLLLASLLTVGAFGLTACSSSIDDVSEGAILRNLTPSLETMNERDADIRRNIAVVHDTNKRLMGSDLRRIFMLDRPSMLAPHSVISFSGNSH